jgi:hypothetical protein
LLALIPLDQFREIAVAMAVGIVIDAIVVRSLLVPGHGGVLRPHGQVAGRPASGPARKARRAAPEVASPDDIDGTATGLPAYKVDR